MSKPRRSELSKQENLPRAASKHGRENKTTEGLWFSCSIHLGMSVEAVIFGGGCDLLHQNVEICQT